jgi:hypothetical protein
MMKVALRQDVADMLKMEKCKTALINNLLSVHFGLTKAHVYDPRRDMARIEIRWVRDTARAVFEVQRVTGWSRNHVIETSFREHLGLSPMPFARLTRRQKTTVSTMREAFITEETFETIKSRFPRFSQDAKNALYDVWIKGTCERIMAERTGGVGALAAGAGSFEDEGPETEGIDGGDE